MISLPQIQFSCDLCPTRVEVEIGFTFLTGDYDHDPQEFYFDASEWMEEHDWHHLDEPNEIACPEHGVME